MPSFSIVLNLLQRRGFSRSHRAVPNWTGKSPLVPSDEYIWRQFYAWHPAFPIDDRVFWLETIWRRRGDKVLGWEYRSFRDERTKLQESMNREI